MLKKPSKPLSTADAVKQARAELRLEHVVMPDWGQHIFSLVEKGELSMPDARRAIDVHVQRLIAVK